MISIKMGGKRKNNLHKDNAKKCKKLHNQTNIITMKSECYQWHAFD